MQPQSILYDPQLLHTLPQKEIRSGLGEVIKHALIGSPALLNYIEQHTQSILALQPETIHYLLAASHRLKCGIVERDEREQGLRRILNFGHTVGHAIEAVQQHQVEVRNKNIINILNNDTAIITTQNIKEASVSQSNENYTHGEAVAVGILYAIALSIRYAHVDRSLLPRLKRLYTQCTLPTTLPCSLDDLCNAMLLDKKRTDTSIRFILLKELGAPFPYQISIDEVAEALKLAHGNIAF
jgi:3-dehydroquinate synthase